MDLNISSKVAMIAAASKGLGKACAQSLLREGCLISICARDEKALDAVRAEFLKERPDAGILLTKCDVSKAEDLERWVSRTGSEMGEPDILVTNTGGPPAARFLQLSDAQWSSGIESTLMNVVRLGRLVVPGMQKKRWGRIVHITSLVAKQPMELLTISSTLRAGLSALTKTMSNELAGDGITVNAVLPGHILTDRQTHLNEIRSKEEGISTEEYAQRVEQGIPIRRFGRPEEIGDVVAFLCSERASYVTGASIQADGGIIKGTF